MHTPLTGACLCGFVRYTCATAPLAMLNCHCRDCQRLGGGPYAPLLIVRFTSVAFVSGELRCFATTRLSGKPNMRGFCPHCGSRLTAGEDRARDIVGLMASSLDDPSVFQPSMDIFVDDAQCWDRMDPVLLKYPQYAARADRAQRCE